MVGLLIINQTFWRLLRFTIILLLLRTRHTCPLTLPRNSPINQCLVHFIVTLSTRTALFLRYSKYQSVTLSSYVSFTILVFLKVYQ